MPRVVTLRTWVLATLEQRRTVRRREQVDLGRQRADVGGRPAVDADPVLDDPLADQLLRERPDGRFDLALATGELGRTGLGDGLGRRVDRRVAGRPSPSPGWPRSTSGARPSTLDQTSSP